MADPLILPELYILRHGETEWNRAGRFQGWLDSALTAAGRQQALAMGALLAAKGVTAQSHHIAASSSGRTRHTAELAFPGEQIALRDDLREIDMGTFAGKSRADLESEGRIAENLDMFDLYAAVPDGETFHDLWDRAGRVLESLSRPSVIVTHGMTSRFLRARALGLGLSGLDAVGGGQGVIYRLAGGRMDCLTPSGS